jgi:hypothetical protein
VGRRGGRKAGGLKTAATNATEKTNVTAKAPTFATVAKDGHTEVLRRVQGRGEILRRKKTLLWMTAKCGLGGGPDGQKKRIVELIASAAERGRSGFWGGNRSVRVGEGDGDGGALGFLGVDADFAVVGADAFAHAAEAYAGAVGADGGEFF